MSMSLPQASAIRGAPIRPRMVVVVQTGPEPAPLVRCLGALALQRSREGLWLAPDAFGVLVAPVGPPLAVLRVLHGLRAALPFRLRVAAPADDAGWTLRAAMATACGWLGGDGPVLLTRAEAVPAPCWVSQAFAALAGPADLALGTPMPPGARPDAASRYAALLAALAARLDPEAGDPGLPPGPEAGLSMAIRAGLLAALGGMPAGPEGGVAGLLRAARQRDARIRLVPGMQVEAALPPAPIQAAAAVRRRLRARRALRGFWADGTGTHAPETPEFRRWAARLGLPAGALGVALAAPRFGEAFAAVAAASPALALHPLPAAALPREILRARLMLATALLRPSPTAPLPAAPAPAQRPCGLVPAGGPAGGCMVRYPAGGSNRFGSCGP